MKTAPADGRTANINKSFRNLRSLTYRSEGQQKVIIQFLRHLHPAAPPRGEKVKYDNE